MTALFNTHTNIHTNAQEKKSLEGYGPEVSKCFSVKGQTVYTSGFGGLGEGIYNMNINEHGCVPRRLYLRKLNFKFHIISICNEILFSFHFFPNHLKM